MSEKLSRPRVTRGITHRKRTGCGNLYVTINDDGNGSGPIEVFARLGKTDGCTTCQNEALTRIVSLGLKYGTPIEEMIEELQGIQCPIPIVFPKDERVLSCADAVAQAMRTYTATKEESVERERSSSI